MFQTTYTRCTAVTVVMACMAGAPSAGATGIVDNFASYAVGSFPSPNWQDVGTVSPSPPIAPLPSGSVISTTDAFGNAIQAFEPVSALASSAGIFQSVPVSSSYSLRADMRVDQYSDAPSSTALDWAMQLTFAQVGDNFAYSAAGRDLCQQSHAGLAAIFPRRRQRERRHRPRCGRTRGRMVHRGINA